MGNTTYFAIAGAALLALSCIRDKEASLPAREYVTEGTTVPSFLVPGAGDAVFRSPDDFEGRTTLLVFFATWCPDCQAELPRIDAVWQALADDPDCGVVAVSRGGAAGTYEQSPEILERYWTEHGLRMPWYLDGDRSVYDRFASAGIPRAYIVDATGTVVWKSAAPKFTAEEYLALLRQYR
ncbi:MAG TPA: TlpA family protein disulfide reductase [Candidatus Tidjanibacter gallistercoris]|nr:TlpA family protein disulfide reductase [Candidatus Tidjanibacter gallistercoris]